MSLRVANQGCFEQLGLHAGSWPPAARNVHAASACCGKPGFEKGYARLPEDRRVWKTGQQRALVDARAGP